MPLHEYQCDVCGHRFEVIRKFSDPPEEVCPKCGATVRKLISAPAFHLKGTGWYLTDYAKKDAGADGKQEAESKADAASGDAKSEQAGKTDKPDKSEKPEKGVKPEKSEPREKSEKSEKSSKPEKSEKAAGSSSTGDSGSSSSTKTDGAPSPGSNPKS